MAAKSIKQMIDDAIRKEFGEGPDAEYVVVDIDTERVPETIGGVRVVNVSGWCVSGLYMEQWLEEDDADAEYDEDAEDDGGGEDGDEDEYDEYDEDAGEENEEGEDEGETPKPEDLPEWPKIGRDGDEERNFDHVYGTRTSADTGATIYEQRFSDIMEFLAYINRETELGDAAKSSMTDDERFAFTGTRTLDEAITLARDGWDEGLEFIHKRSIEITEAIVNKLSVPEIVYDVTGDDLDIGRYVTGDPEDFMSIVPAEIEEEPKVIHLVANIVASWNVSRETMLARGAAVVSMVEALEMHGKRVIIDCVASVGTRSGVYTNDRLETFIRIKEADAPIQLADLAFTLAHASMFRRLVFRAWEMLPGDVRNLFGIGGQYGVVRQVADKESQGDVYVGSLTNNWAPEDAERWVLQQLAVQGLHIKDEEYA